MTEDPYEILGVSRDASPDEIKKAYRKKARECHPDLNPGDPTASERMNKVNEAYDRITNPQKYVASDRRAAQASGGAGQAGWAGGSPQGGYGYDGPFGWTGGWTYVDLDDIFFGGAASSEPIHPEADARDSAEVRKAIDLINSGRYSQAVVALNAIAPSARNARWYYLSALANEGAGNDLTALDHIRRAVQADPTNAAYRRAYQKFQQTGQAYQQAGEQGGFSASFFNPSTCCCGLCALGSFCNPWLCCL